MLVMLVLIVIIIAIYEIVARVKIVGGVLLTSPQDCPNGTSRPVFLTTFQIRHTRQAHTRVLMAAPGHFPT